VIHELSSTAAMALGVLLGVVATLTVGLLAIMTRTLTSANTNAPTQEQQQHVCGGNIVPDRAGHR
jgi:hypothetical protein